MKSLVAISPVNMKERQDLSLRSGDTVRVWQKIEEKGKTRRQAFEGVILAVKHGSEAGATFTVRKVSSGVGVEKVFPLYSPMIDSIELVKRARMRRAKLYFIRRKAARDVKRQMRRARAVAPAEKASVEEASVEAPTQEAVASGQ
jgi:large subunit ribosomal protein L19